MDKTADRLDKEGERNKKQCVHSGESRESGCQSRATIKTVSGWENLK